jgi:hypothetical protein
MSRAVCPYRNSPQAIRPKGTCGTSEIATYPKKLPPSRIIGLNYPIKRICQISLLQIITHARVLLDPPTYLELVVDALLSKIIQPYKFFPYKIRA